MKDRGMLSSVRDFIRPLQGAVMLFVLLVGAVISGTMEVFWPGMGIRFTGGVAGWFRAVPDSYYILLGTLAGAYTVTRGFEKVKGAPSSDTPPPQPPSDDMGTKI